MSRESKLASRSPSRRPVPQPNPLPRRRSAQLLTLLLGGTSALPLLGLAAGCGQNTSLSINILVPPDKDPFAAASSVIVSTAGSDVMAQQSMATVSGGKFSLQLELTSPPHDKYVAITVEGHDGNGQVVARGITPQFILPSSDTTLAVYVGIPGQVTSTSVKLPDDTGNQAIPVGRKLLAGASLRGRPMSPTREPGLGALIVGGANDAAQPVAHAWRYSPILHQLVDAGAPQVARVGAVLVPSADAQQGEQALLWGGAKADGSAVTAAEKFDPTVSDLSQLWSAPDTGLADSGAPGSSSPTVVEVADSLFLITGGSSLPLGTGSTPLSQAVLAQRVAGATADQAARLGIVRISPNGDGSGPMAAARSDHSASPVTLADGSGAVIFGGLSYADRMAGKPVAELFLTSKNSFQPLVLQPTPPVSRRGHVALTLHSGKILIAGGYQEDVAGVKNVQSSALIIDPASRTVAQRDMFLKTPRYAATVTMLNQELVICGGFDSTDSPISSCEAFTNDDMLAPIGSPIPLPHARAGHLALLLETNQLLLVGGVGDQLHAVAEIDIYTAR